jgi:hypothetical protein
MHVMLLIVLVLLIAGVVIWSFAPDIGRRRAVVRWLAAWMFIVAGVFVVLLLFFQEPICRNLGGNWISSNLACQNEWGGNGTGSS